MNKLLPLLLVTVGGCQVAAGPDYTAGRIAVAETFVFVKIKQMAQVRGNPPPRTPAGGGAVSPAPCPPLPGRHFITPKRRKLFNAKRHRAR